MTDRKHVGAGRKFANTDRKREKGFKRIVTVQKKPTITRTVVCEIAKKPVLYDKTDLENRIPVKRKAPQKPETSKVVESTPKDVPVKTSEEKPLELSLDEPTLGGHYELSPLLSKMLEAELQEVMTKVWQLLPDDPRDESEKLVVERFRNKAGDALRNTLGLNVTKRLLNVHNPLYVKIVFSSKPIRADLVNFIKKYNISTFKSVGLRGGTYAAKMQNFQDFDNLCMDKNLKCGKVRVTVTPCYQFTTCPANLRTCYDGKEDSTMNKNNGKNVMNKIEFQDETKSIEKDSSIQQDSVNENKQNVTDKAISTKPNESALEKSAQKVTPVKTNTQGTANKEVAAKVTSAKPIPAAAEKKSPTAKAAPAKPNQAASQTQNSAPKVTPAKSTAVAPSQNSNPKVTPAKSTVVAPSQNSNPKATITKPTAITPPQNSGPKVTPNKSTTVTEPQSTAAKVTPTKSPAVTQAQNTAPKVTPAKPTTAVAKQSAPKNQNSVPKATATKPSNQNTTPKVTPTKPAAPKTQNAAPKPTTKAAAVNNQKANQTAASQPNTKAGVAKAAESRLKVAPKLRQKSPKKKHEGDYDELDDHDILALISEGIVLDECSGSEED